MMKRFLIDAFRKPSAEMLAQRELDDCKRDLLDAQRMRDYYMKIAEFQEVRINRLTQMLRNPEAQ